MRRTRGVMGPARGAGYCDVAEKTAEMELQTVAEGGRGGITGRHGESRRSRLGVLLVAATLVACGGSGGPSGSASPTATFHGSVPTNRGDPARTGVMPGPGPSGRPAIAWQFQAAGSFRQPAVVDGVVYAISSHGVVHALELGSGHERWKVDLGVEVEVAPLVIGELVIAVDTAGTIHALAVSKGTSAWTVRTDGGPMGSAAGGGDRIFAATQNGRVYALDALSW